MHPLSEELKVEKVQCYVCGDVKMCGLVYIGSSDLNVYLCEDDIQKYIVQLISLYDEILAWQT